MAVPEALGPLFVVIPFLDEEKGFRTTLDALASQTDRDFTLILVDNGSRDGSRQVIDEFRSCNPWLDVEVIDEPQKGTGAASDTGFRRAIERGALAIARTDADCIPTKEWIAAARAELSGGGRDFVAGVIRPRGDDHRLTIADRLLIPALVNLAVTFGKLRPANRGPQYRAGYMMAAGNNLAIRAELYRRCGGFPRTRIEDVHEDRALVNRVREVTDRLGRSPEMVVYNSIRRARAYGYTRTLLWYWDHKYRPANVDVR